MITNLEVYENGEIQSKEFSRRIHSIEFYYYDVYYKGKYYEIEVSDDGINCEVENPESEAFMIENSFG
jgi:hypothetical protein